MTQAQENVVTALFFVLATATLMRMFLRAELPGLQRAGSGRWALVVLFAILLAIFVAGLGIAFLLATVWATPEGSRPTPWAWVTLALLIAWVSMPLVRVLWRRLRLMRRS